MQIIGMIDCTQSRQDAITINEVTITFILSYPAYDFMQRTYYGEEILCAS
jgi:hypothetical protein